MDTTMTTAGSSSRPPITVTTDNFYYGDGYEIYDTMFDRDIKTIATAQIVIMVLGSLLTVCDVIILLTSISATTRVKSASWYLFHIVIITVFDGILIKPMMYTAMNVSAICKFVDFASRVLNLVHAQTLVSLNIEILFTILASRPSWSRNRKLRFFISICTMWVFSLVIVGIIVKISQSDYFIYDCYYFGWQGELALHILKNWLPAAIIMCTTIAAIVIYVCQRRGLAVYNQFAENSADVVNPGEWFVCLMVVNVLFIILDVVLYDMHIHFTSYSFLTDVLLQMCVLFTRFVTPFALLSLSSVRATLRKALCSVYRTLVSVYTHFTIKRDRRNVSDAENQMLDMDAIDDQSL